MTLQLSGQRFGKLTVLSNRVVKNRNRAECVCDCGRKRTVLVQHLRAGNTKSCGKASCREKREVSLLSRKRAPNGARVLSLPAIRKAWESYHHEDTSKQRSIPQLAVRHNVSASTLHDIFRVVRDVGGIEAYEAFFKESKQ